MSCSKTQRPKKRRYAHEHTNEETRRRRGTDNRRSGTGKRPAASEDYSRPVVADNSNDQQLRNPGSDGRDATDAVPLFPHDELEKMRGRWNGIQTAFVDEPRRAVEQADGLVASGMKRLAEVFAEERARLEAQWDRGDNVSTEELRLALQRYRSFFHRLLNV
jgi:hypothetical protein